MEKEQDVIIIGSGPAGITASIYSIRANLKTLVIAGNAPGGQLMITTDVDDFPGFPGGIQGPELMDRMRKQAELLGVKFIDENVIKVDFKKKPFKLNTEDRKFIAKSVIIATGASAKWMGLDSEKRLIGKGVSACATCDGFFYKNKEVIVIGGGDTALREATFLAKICKTVTVIHRRDQLRAQAALVDKANSIKNIKWIWNSTVEEFLGKEKLESVKLKNLKNNKTSDLKCEGAFVAIGHKPNTDFLRGHIGLDDHGYVIVHDEVKTNVKGIFAAGDIYDYRYQQAVTAAGAGCMAAMEANEYIDNLKHKK